MMRRAGVSPAPAMRDEADEKNFFTAHANALAGQARRLPYFKNNAWDAPCAPFQPPFALDGAATFPMLHLTP